jgi:hypothetical protein
LKELKNKFLPRLATLQAQSEELVHLKQSLQDKDSQIKMSKEETAIVMSERRRLKKELQQSIQERDLAISLAEEAERKYTTLRVDSDAVMKDKLVAETECRDLKGSLERYRKAVSHVGKFHSPEFTQRRQRHRRRSTML